MCDMCTLRCFSYCKNCCSQQHFNMAIDEPLKTDLQLLAVSSMLSLYDLFPLKEILLWQICWDVGLYKLEVLYPNCKQFLFNCFLCTQGKYNLIISPSTPQLRVRLVMDGDMIMTPRRKHEQEKKEKKEREKKPKRDKFSLKPSTTELFKASKHFVTHFKTFFADTAPSTVRYSDEFLLQACERYEKWLHFKRKYFERSLFLPADVRLVYLVHVTQPYNYYKTCKCFFGRVIDLQVQAHQASATHITVRSTHTNSSNASTDE